MWYGEEIWRFETANTVVRCMVRPCDDDPADSFEFDEDIEAVRSGAVEWFDASVLIERNDKVIGADHLGACSYYNVNEFISGHRDPNPMHRNCTIMRNSACPECHGLGDLCSGNVCPRCKGVSTQSNTVIGHYFPSMISEAIADARKTLKQTR